MLPWFNFNIIANDFKSKSCERSKQYPESEKIIRDDYFFETSAFDDVIKIDSKSRKTIIAEGTETCPLCKKKKLMIRQIQTKSADEGMTTFFKCLNCNHVWSS